MYFNRKRIKMQKHKNTLILLSRQLEILTRNGETADIQREKWAFYTYKIENDNFYRTFGIYKKFWLLAANTQNLMQQQNNQQYFS